MIYEEATHPKIKVGQLWRSAPPEKETILIVAIDSCLSKFVINIFIENEAKGQGIVSVLSPIAWEGLEPCLAELLNEGIDVSRHLESYEEWKTLAQEGKAGYFGGLSTILLTCRGRE